LINRKYLGYFFLSGSKERGRVDSHRRILKKKNGKKFAIYWLSNPIIFLNDSWRPKCHIFFWIRFWDYIGNLALIKKNTVRRCLNSLLSLSFSLILLSLSLSLSLFFLSFFQSYISGKLRIRKNIGFPNVTYKLCLTLASPKLVRQRENIRVRVWYVLRTNL